MDSLHDLLQPLSQSEIQSVLKSVPTSTAFTDSLRNLQGNILRSHGRNYATHLFLCFQSDKQNAVKEWIAGFAYKLTSALDQLEKDERQSMFQSF